MKHLSILLLFLTLAMALGAAERPTKPNVILILTDDLGWQDVKCYDIDDPSPYQTPHLDALAKKGMMFWQAYSPAPTCAPSRCAIISGNHPARAQKTHVVGGAPPHPRNKHVRMMDPWYSGRMPEDELTIARALASNGYTTAHSGKWHIAINHNAFPQPKDLGFQFTHSDRGSRQSMKDRLTGFATTEEDDPFRLDENGYPFHQTNQDALSLLDAHKAEPFFLYYATWLVHSPIHTRSKAHLDYYTQKLGVDPTKTNTKDTPGQKNPFYAAMVQELDYYLGQVFSYLDTTDDPRWPGHKLSENTYLIFTSDNGGMEGGPSERYTDNHPLARGKISAMEGGTRVPLIITGPGIEPGTQTDTIANGLDFYPTILAMTNTPKPANKNLDGCNLLPLLKKQDPITHPDGSTRDTMVWHFPHGSALESTIRVGDFKLVRNYDHLNTPSTPPLELFQLYDDSQRVDIEESKNLVDTLPDKAREMDAALTTALRKMKASPPYYNPDCTSPLPNQDKVATPLTHQRNGNTVTLTFQDNGAKVTQAHLIYTLNGGERYEEWFRHPGTLNDNTATYQLPQGTTHYYLNLIDENNFLRSYPKVNQTDQTFTQSALKAQGKKTGKTEKPKNQAAIPNKGTLQKNDRIVFLGDSITAAGVREGGYITIASQAIAEAHPDLNIELIGAGISGHKVPDCQRRLDKDVLQKKPTIVFIYLGINDVWHWTHPKVVAQGRKGTTPEDFENGLNEMIAKINKTGARVILCTPTVIGEKSDGSNPEDKRLEQYADISRKVARETNSQLLDLRKSLLNQLKKQNPQQVSEGIFTRDGVHMNEKGNRLLSQLVLKALKVTAPPKN